MIVGIQQDSWITKRQISKPHLHPQNDVQDSMFLELIGEIDPKYLADHFKRLECLNDPKLFYDRDKRCALIKGG